MNRDVDMPIVILHWPRDVAKAIEAHLLYEDKIKYLKRKRHSLRSAVLSGHKGAIEEALVLTGQIELWSQQALLRVGLVTAVSETSEPRVS